jgi:hypothetical protein
LIGRSADGTAYKSKKEARTALKAADACKA